MPYIIETPFDQNNYLKRGEAGVCNALVLEWLAQKGEPMKDMRRTINRARKAHAKGVNVQMFTDYGLFLNNGETADGVRGQAMLDNFVQTVMDLVSTSYLIGMSGAAGGHAIGMIKLSPSNYLGFDPNNGYYRMGDGGEITWLVYKIFDEMIHHQFRDLQCWGCI